MSAYVQGFHAGFFEICMSFMPYEKGSEEWFDWISGYGDGQEYEGVLQ